MDNSPEQAEPSGDVELHPAGPGACAQGCGPLLLRVVHSWAERKNDEQARPPTTAPARMTEPPPARFVQEEAKLRMPTLRQKYPYQVTDQGFALRGRPFNVTVAWQMMPWVGRLYTHSQTFTGLQWEGGKCWLASHPGGPCKEYAKMCNTAKHCPTPFPHNPPPTPIPAQVLSCQTITARPEWAR